MKVPRITAPWKPSEILKEVYQVEQWKTDGFLEEQAKVEIGRLSFLD